MCTARHIRNIKPNFNKKIHNKSLGCHCKSTGEIDKIEFHAMVIRYYSLEEKKNVAEYMSPIH